MPRRFLALFFLAPLALVFAADSQTQFKYPPAPTSNQVDDYSGTKVADPYRPLENPDAPESRKWIEAENKITFDLQVKNEGWIADKIDAIAEFYHYKNRSRAATAVAAVPVPK